MKSNGLLLANCRPSGENYHIEITPKVEVKDVWPYFASGYKVPGWGHKQLTYHNRGLARNILALVCV